MKKAIFVILLFFIVAVGQTLEPTKRKFLDREFGNGGVVITDVRNHSLDHGNEILLQPDGKILVCGETCKKSLYPCDAVLLRYNSNGTLDSTFGQHGRVVSNYFGEFDNAKALAFLPDGRIYVGAESKRIRDRNWHIVIARFTPNGIPDLSFGEKGVVHIDRNLEDRLGGIALVNNALFVAGTTQFKHPGNDYFNSAMLLMRLNEHGDLDSGFGTNGVLTVPLGRDTSANSMIVKPNGKIVLGGSVGRFSYYGRGTRDFALTSVAKTGNLDRSFGTGGSIRAYIKDADEIIEKLLLQKDGKILAVGEINNGWNGWLAVARFNSNGTLDSTFSRNGKLQLWYFPPAKAIVQDRQGGFIIAAEMNNGIIFLRLNTDGSLDKTFGFGGGFEFNNSELPWYVNGMTIDSTGRYTIVGSRSNGPVSDIMLARFKM